MTDTAPSGLRVFIGGISAGHPHLNFVQSHHRLFAEPSTLAPFRIVHSYIEPNGPYLAAGRNNVVREALKAEWDWMLWLDDDMEFTVQDVRSLLTHALAYQTRFASGVYSNIGGKREKFCVAYDLRTPTPDDHSYAIPKRGDLPNAILVDGRAYCAIRPEDLPAEPRTVDAVGFGFCVVHRSLLTEMHDAFAPDVKLPHPVDGHDMNPAEWFDDPIFAGVHWGEDFTFCYRAAALDSPPLLVPTIQLTHYKTTPITPNPNGF